VERTDGPAVRVGRDRGLRRENRDTPAHPVTVRRPRRGDRRVGAGRDDADDRNRRHFLDRVERERRRRVARHDDRLDALRKQEPDGAAGVAPHGLGRLRAVWQARRVAEIEEVLERHPPRNGVEHREATNSGVEEADRPRVAHARSAGARRGGTGRAGGAAEGTEEGESEGEGDGESNGTAAGDGVAGGASSAGSSMARLSSGAIGWVRSAWPPSVSAASPAPRGTKRVTT